MERIGSAAKCTMVTYGWQIFYFVADKCWKHLPQLYFLRRRAHKLFRCIVLKCKRFALRDLSFCLHFQTFRKRKDLLLQIAAVLVFFIDAFLKVIVIVLPVRAQSRILYNFFNCTLVDKINTKQTKLKVVFQIKTAIKNGIQWRWNISVIKLVQEKHDVIFLASNVICSCIGIKIKVAKTHSVTKFCI